MNICKVCGCEFKNASHFRKHKMTSREYYDIYILKDGDDKCRVCGSETHFQSFKKGYRNYCSPSCSSLDTWTDERKDKKRKQIRDLGEEYRKKLSESAKKSWRNRSHESKKNSLKNLEKAPKYGSIEFEEKMNERFGVNNYFKLDSFKSEIKSREEEIQKRKKDTTNKKYGCDYYMQSDEGKRNYELKRREGRVDLFLTQLKNKNLKMLSSIDEFINGNNINIKCLKCNNEFQTKELIICNIHCNNPIHKYRSEAENEIYNEIKGFEIQRNKRFYYDKQRHYEVDLFIEEKKLAIDYHGLYWHSEIFKDKDSHRRKYLYFKDMGIRLIQVFESEWANKRDCVLSIINSKLGKNKVIYARKCKIRELSQFELSSFLEKNHIQGAVNCSNRYGLFYEDNLYSVLGFSKSRYDSEYDHELVRFCNRIGFTVIGGFSKLLNRIDGSVVSYCDLRYFTGDSYKNSDLSYISDSKPNYYYFKKGKSNLYNRIKFQKHKLEDLLDKFDKEASEHDNMINNGYLRIYDCGMSKFGRKNEICKTKIN